MHEILTHFGFKSDDCRIENFGNGLINDTFLLHTGNEKFIFQKVNHSIFKKPELIAENIDVIAKHLAQQHPGYFFTEPIKSVNGNSLIYIDGKGYYRAFPFVKNSRSIDVVKTPGQAYEAALQFGKFTKMLAGISIDDIKITLPSFHDLLLRYDQFTEATKNGNANRIAETEQLINQLLNYNDIVEEYKTIIKNPQFKVRVTHHDTKISNVLFDENDKGICVIDLDTVMPGYFISDVGDMMRTYLCPVSEEENDFSKIQIREEFYKAIVQGYLSYMQDELTDTEKGYFFYAGKFIIYMQALRFLTDYVNNDIYYGAKYEKHNYVRAQNQATLLQRLLEKESILLLATQEIIGMQNIA